MDTTNMLLCYGIAINFISFITYGLDKLRARKKWHRTSEATLLWLAVIGGSVGAWTGMKIWHHKTLHKKFKYGVPIIIITQVAIAITLYMK